MAAAFSADQCSLVETPMLAVALAKKYEGVDCSSMAAFNEAQTVRLAGRMQVAS